MIEAKVASDVVSSVRAIVYGSLSAIFALKKDLCVCKGEGLCYICHTYNELRQAAGSVNDLEHKLRSLAKSIGG